MFSVLIPVSIEEFHVPGEGATVKRFEFPHKANVQAMKSSHTFIDTK
jgi:hypothetical protein